MGGKGRDTEVWKEPEEDWAEQGVTKAESVGAWLVDQAGCQC